MRLKPLSEQVVVLFGASSGIGRETALRMAQRGARVVVAARVATGLETLVDEIRAAGGQAVAAPAEVTDFTQVKAVADRAAAEFGRLDTWVHLAAVSIYAPFSETQPDEFRQVIDVDLNGQAYGAMAALPYLKRDGGALILVSSIEGERGMPYHSAYAAAKHGIEGMIEALRLELKHEGAPVSVTSIKPASINTPFFEKARTRLGVEPKGIPPVYEPGVVAGAIMYAAEHPVPEVVAGGAGKMLIWLQTLAPRLADAVLLRIGFSGQRTAKPKPEGAPDSLYTPVPGYDRAQGAQSRQARPFSIYTWLATHPVVRAGVAVAAVGGLAAAALLAFRDRE